MNSNGNGFTLGETARVVPRPAENGHAHGQLQKRARRNERQVTSWSEFLPLLNQIRARPEYRTAHAALYAMGYSGSSLLAEWERRGVPMVALNAALGVLAKMSGRFEPRIVKVRQLERDECADLLGLVARLPVTEPRVANWISRLAQEINAAA